MYSGSPSLLCQADNGSGNAPGLSLGIASATDGHGQVSILIDDGHYVRKEAVAFGRKEVTVLVFLVVLLDVGNKSLAEKLIALLHLGHQRFEDLLGLVRLLHYRIVQLFPLVVARENGEVVMEEASVMGELDHLGIDKDELEFRRVL